MKNTLLIICLFFLQYGCSSDGTGNNDPDSANRDPDIANLIFPYESSLCNEGTNVTPTQSTVLFEWEASSNTDSYTINLKNLSNGDISSNQTSATEIPIVLNRATPYEWFIISESNTVGATAQSEIWQFYNAAEGIQTYAPFPAEIISPLMAETITTTLNEITLDWNGSDVDDDIVGYNIYFDTASIPEIFQSNLIESNLNVSITTNTIYYWKIITKDSQGNSSDSGVYQFKIQ